MANKIAIHPTAIVSPKARIGNNVKIGQYTTIYDNVYIDDDTIIEGYCEIGVSNPLSQGKLLYIGKISHIRSHSIIYEGSHFESQLETGHNVCIRENTIVGKNLRIGTLSDIQGHCVIGDYVRMHSNVHIGQDSKIGSFVWIFPYVVLTNDPTPPSDNIIGPEIEDYVVIATMSVILPGVKVRKYSVIGAHSVLTKNTEEGMLYVGVPAKKVCPARDVNLKDGTGRSAYPWIRHFRRGYPEEVIKKWEEENG